jgi:hypothetical protein
MSSDSTATGTVTLEYHVVPCQDQSPAGSVCPTANTNTAFGCCPRNWLIVIVILIIVCFVLTYLKLRQIARRLGDGPNDTNDSNSPYGPTSSSDGDSPALVAAPLAPIPPVSPVPPAPREELSPNEEEFIPSAPVRNDAPTPDNQVPVATEPQPIAEAPADQNSHDMQPQA